MKYWFNVRTGQVEDDQHTSRKEDLMGPYPTREAAAQALASAAQRTAKWEEEERAEREREDKDPLF